MRAASDTCQLCTRAISYVQSITPGIVCQLTMGGHAHLTCIERWMARLEREVEATFEGFTPQDSGTTDGTGDRHGTTDDDR